MLVIFVCDVSEIPDDDSELQACLEVDNMPTMSSMSSETGTSTTSAPNVTNNVSRRRTESNASNESEIDNDIPSDRGCV